METLKSRWEYGAIFGPGHVDANFREEALYVLFGREISGFVDFVKDDDRETYRSYGEKESSTRHSPSKLKWFLVLSPLKDEE